MLNVTTNFGGLVGDHRDFPRLIRPKPLLPETYLYHERETNTKEKLTLFPTKTSNVINQKYTTCYKVKEHKERRNKNN